MKKIIPILVIVIFALSGFGANATQFSNIETAINWEQTGTLGGLRDDELDQYQLDMDFAVPIGRWPLNPEINYMVAQAFTPTKNVLTRVELLAGKNSTTINDFVLAIKDDIYGTDLTSISLPPDNFPTENFSWVEFDFDDIAVTPGLIYYMVAYTESAPDNYYAWTFKNSNAYPNGTVFVSEDEGTIWIEEADADMTFKTYGRDNLPPETPIIDGETEGQAGEEYEYTFVSTDPEGDDIYYEIEWGCGETESTDYYPSGETGSASHAYTEGTYIIRVKAIDINEGESDWGTLEITMPKNMPFMFSFLNRLFERFPNAFPILRHLIGL